MDIRKFIIWWNSKFPLDYWWRNKHNIPFNSSNHREIDFIDQKIECTEEEIYKEIRDKNNEESDYPSYEESGMWLQPEKQTKEDIESQELSDEEFEDIPFEELEGD